MPLAFSTWTHHPERSRSDLQVLLLLNILILLKDFFGEGLFVGDEAIEEC